MATSDPCSSCAPPWAYRLPLYISVCDDESPTIKSAPRLTAPLPDHKQLCLFQNHSICLCLEPCIHCYCRSAAPPCRPPVILPLLNCEEPEMHVPVHQMGAAAPRRVLFSGIRQPTLRVLTWRRGRCVHRWGTGRAWSRRRRGRACLRTGYEGRLATLHILFLD